MVSSDAPPRLCRERPDQTPQEARALRELLSGSATSALRKGQNRVGMARAKSFRRWVRHPVTHKQFRLSAPTLALLAELLDEIRVIRHKYKRNRAGLTQTEVDTQIRAIRGQRSYTLAEAATAYVARESLADNTRKGVLSLVRSHAARLAPIELNALDSNTLKAWVDHLRARQVSVTSILCYWRRLRAVVVYAIERDWIGVLPWGDYVPKLSGRDPKERESCRSVDELERLLSSALEIDRREGFRHYLEAKIATSVSLGLRQGELAGLRWPDLRETEGVIIVARQYAGRLTKTKHRPKRLEVSDELFVILGEHRARLEELELYSPAGPIFPAPHRSRPGEPRPYDQGECLTTRSLRAVVHLAGLPNQKAWSSHSLRDTFATLEAIGHGGDLATTAQRTRHKSIPALARYIRAVRRQTPPPGFTLPSGDRPPLLPPRSDDPEPTK